MAYSAKPTQVEATLSSWPLGISPREIIQGIFYKNPNHKYSSNLFIPCPDDSVTPRELFEHVMGIFGWGKIISICDSNNSVDGVRFADSSETLICFSRRGNKFISPEGDKELLDIFQSYKVYGYPESVKRDIETRNLIRQSRESLGLEQKSALDLFGFVYDPDAVLRLQEEEHALSKNRTENDYRLKRIEF